MADGNGNQVRKIDNNGLRITIAGTYYSGPSVSHFHLPENVPLAFVSSVAVLSNTELIVADTYHHVIKKVDLQTKSRCHLSQELCNSRDQ